VHIGLDFDNTIVSYDDLIYRVAEEQGLLSGAVARNKVAVRDQLRNKGLEQTWIEMQGQIYGPRMKEAVVYPGFMEFLTAARADGHILSIISHKTLRPFAGPPHDLHASARDWIATHLVCNGAPVIEASHIHFETTKPGKIARIGTIGCDVFVDDLPEILLDRAMPVGIRKVLYDPDDHFSDADQSLIRVTRWDDVRRALDG
jgi:hypothetical protein